MAEGAREQARELGGMSHHTAAWLAWSIAALSLVLCLAAISLYLVTLPVQPPSSWGTGGLSAVLYVYLPFLAFPLVGAVIASRRPKNPIGWICLAVGTIWIFAIMSSSYAMYALLVASPGSVPFPAAIASLGEELAPATAGLIGTFLLLLFPDGRLPSRRWRPLAWLSGAVIISMIVGGILTPGRLQDLGVRNPFELEGHPWVGNLVQSVTLLLPFCILASAVSLVVRFVRSEGEEREQIKWLAFAALILGLGFASFVIPGILMPESAEGANTIWGNLLEDAVTLSFAGIPVAIGFAVLKYRLYDIDVVINRTLVYGSLTVMLAVVYFGGVATTQAIFQTLTGQEEQPQLAVVISTLLIAALFNPLRRRIQSFIDRRFYRSKYDARKTLEAFSAKLRDETDLEALNNELVGVVRETMQPAHVSLWLRPDTTSKGQQEG
jgi:hypothetical protein